jgi:hypothetical protein
MKRFRVRRTLQLQPGTRAGLLIACLIISAIVCSAQTTPGADGWVVLPVDDYRALREAAFPAEREPEPPPVEATLTRVDYDLKVDGEVAIGEARLTIDVIKNGWVRVAIPAGLMVREAQLDGRPVSLAVKEANSNYVLLSRSGRSLLTLSIVAPVSSTAGTEILRLPSGSSAICRATLTLPRQDPQTNLDLHVTGGLVLEKSETANQSRWVVHGRGAEPLTFAWKRKVEDQRATQALRLRGSLSQLIGLGEDTTQFNAEVRIEVLQGLAREVRLRLPEQFTVNQVSGPAVADWETAPQELIVTFVEPVQQATRFSISGELRLPREGQIAIPLIRLTAAERETGGLAVEVLGAGEIKDRKAAGLDEAEAADLGQLISSRQSPSLIAFRLRPADGKSDRSLELNVARYTPQAVLSANVEEARYNLLITDDGKLLVQSRLAVRNNQRNFLKVSLPSTATLWSASVAGRPVRPGRAPDGSLLLPLEKTKGGDEAPAFAVEITYLDRVASWSEKGRAKVSLLSFDMPVSRSGVLIHYSPAFRLTAAPGNFRIAPYEAPASTALHGAVTDSTAINASAATPIAERQLNPDPTQDLVTRVQTSTASRPIRNLPIRVVFPHFGPSLFLASELTSETQTPVLEFDYQRDKKRGDQ